MSNAIDLLVRVSLLLGTAFLAALVLHRRSASVRHLVWSASLGGSLVLAVVVPWSPRMDVTLKWWRVARPPAVVTAPALATTRDGLEGSEPAPMQTVVNDDAERTGRSITTMRDRTVPSWLTLWLTGTTLVLLWGVWGRIGLARIVRRARRVIDGPWVRAVKETTSSLGVRRPVTVFVSTEVGAPMTWGARQPVLVVPVESEAWTNDLRRAVAAHELAHVARNDYAMQLMALVACAVYWFHPLAWMVARRMKLAAEKACDDHVLMLGTTGEEYASHLIGIARSARSLRLAGAVAIGMARSSTLEGRIMAVLDSTRLRGAPTPRGRRVIGIAAAVTLMLLGGIQPVPAAARVADAAAPVPTVAAPYNEVVTQPADFVTNRPKSASVTPAAPLVTQGVGQGQQSSKEDVVTASAGEELNLDLDTGGDVIVRGWDEPRVRVRTRLAGTNWQDVEVRVERQTNGVRVTSRYPFNRNNWSSDNRFEINVPRRFDVRISSAGGSLTLMDIEGRFTGHTGGGDFVLERLTGSSSLTTGGGEIHVTDSDLSGRVQTGGGTVLLSNVRGGLRGSSGSGPVIYGDSTVSSGGSTSSLSAVGVNDSRISVGREYRGGTLNINKAGGNVDLEAAPNGARVQTGGGRVTVGRAGGDVRATTGGGDVTVGPASGSVSAGTGAGEVRVIVDGSPAADQVIEAWSGSGRIIIELPADFDGRLELETAHTRTHEGTARITSDFELNREPLTDWEDRYGSPRRYLRASAVLGRANRRVIVRTVNGEIVIKRR